VTDSPVVLREARAADLDALGRLELEAFAEPWRATDLALRLDHADHLVLVAGRGGEVVGYALFQRAAGEAELQRMAVRTEARGQGLGGRLLAEGLHRLRRAGDSACFLEVRDSNLAARRLYERAGFALLGRRRAYYANGEDGLLYRLAL
jgi:ribosomal-protein-alanine N-acetyltransferase